MAGKEETSSGVAELAPGATVGLLEQEPELDDAKTVRENVEDGVRELRDLLDRFNAISAQFAEPDADFDALLAEQAAVQDQIDRRDAWQLDAHARPRDGRAARSRRRPRRDVRSRAASAGGSRCAGCCSSAPDLLLLDEPTNHLDAESVLWLERFLADYKGTVVAVTHDRYFLDNVAGWILELDRGRGIPYQGNYSGWLEQKQARLARRRSRVRAPAHAAARARVGAPGAARAAREVEGAPRRLRAAARRGGGRQARPRRDPHPAGPAARRRRDRGEAASRRASATGCSSRASSSRCRRRGSSA